MAYFDNNATTRPFPEVRDAITEALNTCWANPSSPHRAGGRARARIERARERIAEDLGVDPKGLTFCSGATEANNAILAWMNKESSSSWALVSKIEHPSILESARFSFKGRVDHLPINSQGVVEYENLERLIEQKRPSLVSVMAAHNETGVLQPWREVAELCRNLGIWFHCDATQWIGKVKHAGFDRCSSFSFSAHKFGGPKGVGVLVTREPVSWIQGGGQEMNTRGGTENLSGIIGLETAWERLAGLSHEVGDRSKWKSDFEAGLRNEFADLTILGNESPRLWNTSLLALPEFDNLSWIGKLDKLGYSLSTGSACSTGRNEASGLSEAIGLTQDHKRRLVRASSFWDTTEEQWLGLARAISRAYYEMKQDRDRSGVISI